MTYIVQIQKNNGTIEVLRTERTKTVQEVWEQNAVGVQVYEVLDSKDSLGYEVIRKLEHSEVIANIYGHSLVS